jgi:hypothetical protein
MAIAIGAVFMALAATAFLTIPQMLIHIYTHDRQTVDVGVRLLAVAAVFQVFDGIQGIGTGALRGLGKTQGPMLIDLVTYGVTGLANWIRAVFQKPLRHLRSVERPAPRTRICWCAGAHDVAKRVKSKLKHRVLLVPRYRAKP